MCGFGIRTAACLLVIVGTSGCRSSRPHSGAVVGPDSVTAVRAATAALSAIPGVGDGPYRVVSFRRDSVGILIGLQRPNAVLGGGGVVRVGRDGSAAVKQLWQ